MARVFYRFYLYTVFTVLLLFAVVVTAQLLHTILLFLPWSLDERPSQATFIQALVLALVGWLVAGSLGGFHYWLIRRDIRSEPAAGSGAIRALFLNVTEGIGVLVAVTSFGLAIGNWSFSFSYLMSSLASALPTLGMVAFLEWERRRFPTQGNAGLFFQRLHFFGVQLYLLGAMIIALMSDLLNIINTIFFHYQPYYCDYCSPYNIVGKCIELIWFILAWLIYCQATRQDTSRNTRMVMHGLSLAVGIGFVLLGTYILTSLLLQPLYHTDVSFMVDNGINSSYNFLAPLVAGTLVTTVYHLLLSNLSQRTLVSRHVRRLTEWSIAGLLLAGAFWVGCGLGLYNIFRLLGHAENGPGAQDWIGTIGFIMVGLGYIPLDLYLRRSYALDPANALGPRRGFVLALLAAGILTAAIGGSVALYAGATALLGSPLYQWQEAARSSLAAFLVGATVLSIYLWTTRQEHLIARQKDINVSQVSIQPVPVVMTVEGILDALLAGQLTREEAATRIRTLESPAQTYSEA